MNFIKGAGLHIHESRGMKECEDGEEDRKREEEKFGKMSQ